MLIEELRYHGGLHFVGKIIFDKNLNPAIVKEIGKL